jgi:hypothetical protein
LTSARIEHLGTVSGMPWTAYAGERRAVFAALGQDAADAIHATRADSDGGWPRLLRAAARDPDRAERLRRVEASSRRLLPVEAAELDALAAGAGLPAADLWTLNLRGDLGEDGAGCSDVCVASSAGLAVGHNEDGVAADAPGMRLVTLRIDGDPTVTALWYPGMLPANAWTATSAGLVFGMDHVPVHRADLDGAGRHLLARYAQRQESGPAAVAALTSIPCAGGFSFDLGDRVRGEARIVECAAGRAAVAEARVGAQPLRHTNHLRLLDGTVNGLRVADQRTESRERAGRLGARLAELASDSAVDAGPADPVALDAERVFAALRSEGICKREDDHWTLATFVSDLTHDRLLVQGAGQPWRGRLSALAAGLGASVAALDGSTR